MDEKQLGLLIGIASGVLVLMERAITETSLDNARAAAMSGKPFSVQHQQLRTASNSLQDALKKVLAA